MPHRRWLHGKWEDEHGFTLAEVMVTVVIMGILAAVAMSLWWSVIESRRVDSATNQLAADLRQAHSMSTNRLVNQTLTLTADQSEYTKADGVTVDLDDNYDTGPAGDVVSVAANSAIVFHADGTAQVAGANPITVRATNDTGNNHTIEINSTTSEIKVVP